MRDFSSFTTGLTALSFVNVNRPSITKKLSAGCVYISCDSIVKTILPRFKFVPTIGLYSLYS